MSAILKIASRDRNENNAWPTQRGCFIGSLPWEVLRTASIGSELDPLLCGFLLISLFPPTLPPPPPRETGRRRPVRWGRGSRTGRRGSHLLYVIRWRGLGFRRRIHRLRRGGFRN